MPDIHTSPHRLSHRLSHRAAERILTAFVLAVLVGGCDQRPTGPDEPQPPAARPRPDATPTNVALGKPVTASVSSLGAPYSAATDGITTTNPYVDLGSGVQWLQVDLQGSYDLSKVSVSHYWGDWRTYHDVIIRVSADGVNFTTVFNNDQNGSAGLGAGSDAEYIEPSAGKEVLLPTPLCARYVRFYSNGSTVNVYNHYVEVRAIGTSAANGCATNVALGKPVTASVASQGAPYAAATDGVTTTNPYVDLSTGVPWLQVDLQGSYDLSKVTVSHYWGDWRTYHDVIIRVSADGVNFTTIFNNDQNGSAGLGVGSDAEYVEPSAGKEVPLPTPRCARYVRFYSNGSSVNASNHYVEVRAFGTPSSAGCGSPATQRVFAATSFWYTPIPSSVPLHPSSANFVAEFIRQKNAYYGTVSINTHRFSSPVYTADAGTAAAPVSFWDCQNKGYTDAGLVQQWNSVPVPSYAAPDTAADHEMTIYRPATDELWEFWQARKVNGQWQACWGGGMHNVSQNPGIWPYPYGASATGLPFIGGQITAEELQRGEIDHVIGISLVDLERFDVFSWPANRSDGYNPDGAANRIPEGLRFRLDPSVNVDALNLHPVAKTIARAAQTYGFVVWDKAGAITLRARNPQSYTALGQPNPYVALFNGTPEYAILNGFPWDRLQFLPMDYGKP